MYFCNTCQEKHETEQLCPKPLSAGGICYHGWNITDKNCPVCFPKEVSKDIRQQSHYTQHKIQPVVFIGENKLDFLAGNVVKYVSRYNMKNGVEDLEKARHYLDMLIQRENGEGINP